jgi:hypothetical protein
MRPGCNNVENTNLVTAKKDTDLSFPNMYKSEMMGTSSITSKYASGEFIKHKEDIMMLCCECNCGTSHGEFEYSKATDDELKLAKLSKYNMITPYDHGDNIIKDNEAPHGYRTITKEDLDYREKRKKSNIKTRNGLNALLAYSGLSLNNLFKDKAVKKERPKEESNKYIFKAEIKRRIKALNKEIQKSGDVYKLTELKHQLLEAKKLYKTA